MGDKGVVYLKNVEAGFMGYMPTFRANIVEQMGEAGAAGANAFLQSASRMSQKKFDAVTGNLAGIFERELLYAAQGTVPENWESSTSDTLIARSDVAALITAIQVDGTRTRVVLEHIRQNTLSSSKHLGKMTSGQVVLLTSAR
jgi:hypothetical protein